MSDIATKLTYLNTTKQLLKENINSLGGNLTTEPFRQYASVLEGIYERIPKVSGIGSSLSLSPTMVGKIKLNEIQGDTLQDGTPTPDTPIPIENVTGLQKVNVCGKNILSSAIEIGEFNPKTGEKRTGSGAYRSATPIPVTPNTTYKFSIDGTGYAINVLEYDKNGGFIDYLTGSAIAANNSFTTSNNARYINIYKGTTGGNEKWQLELGSSSTGYKPYKSNTYEVNLGKNLISSITKQGNTLKFNGTVANEDYIFKAGTYTFSYTKNISSSITTFIKDTTGTQTSLGTGTTITFTSNFDFNIWLYRSGITTDDVSEVQLEKGSQVTSYSSYFTPIELNKIGNYEDSIKKSTGKNLFDKDNVTSGYINADGSITSNNSYVTSDYITIDSSLSYSKTATNSPRIKLYDKDKNIISNESYSDISSFGNAGTYTIPYTNAKYIRFTIRLDSSGVDINSVMFNEGSTLLPYEPYGKVWYIEKQIGKVILDGTENWVKSGSTAVDRFLLDFTDAKGFSQGYANYFIVVTSIDTTVGNFIFNNATQIVINYSTYGTTTKDQFKTWLSTHNTQVNYILVTPTYTEITNTELINQLESIKSQDGTTNISITSEDLEMILNVSALKGDAE
jgi:hypothetical protein